MRSWSSAQPLSRSCQTPLADAEVVLRERRQVHELPPAVRLRSTEHQALHVRCPACQEVSVGAFPAEAPSRAQYGPQLRALAVYLVEEQLCRWDACSSLLSRPVRRAAGTRARWCAGSGRRRVTLGPVEAELKVALRQARRAPQ